LTALDLRGNGSGSMEASLWPLLTSSGAACPPLRELDLADTDLLPLAVRVMASVSHAEV
jgi:hypothetical protein